MNTDTGGAPHRDHAEALRAAVAGAAGVTEASLRIAMSARAAVGHLSTSHATGLPGRSVQRPTG